MAERFGDYSTAVNRVSNNLRALLPNSTSAGIRQRGTSLGSYATQLSKQVGGYGTSRGSVGGYGTKTGSGLTSYNRQNPLTGAMALLASGPSTYQAMLARNQFNPKTAVGANAQTQTQFGSPNITSDKLTGTMQWQNIMQEAGNKLNVPWQVLASIMAIETGGNNANDPGGAMGLMQIMPNYWQDLANQFGGDLTNPRTNIFTAAAILRQNYEAYGSWDKAAAAYFGGAGAFNPDGSYSTNADSYGTDINAYVSAFQGYMQQLGYGQPTAGETFSGGQPATPAAGKAVEYAFSAQGTPYVWGGQELSGFDCSGLMYWAYAQAGVQLPRTAQAQYDATQRITSQQLQAGDLIFFQFPPDMVSAGQGNMINHVAMYVGNGQFIQASSNGSVVGLRSLNDSFYSQYMVGFGRV